MKEIEIGQIYRHYKGGRYYVTDLAERHTHNGDIDVLYFSLTYGKRCTRPLRQDSRKEDSWTDVVPWPDGVHRQRFTPESQLLQVELKRLETLWEMKNE
jgi:hypothetical protein